MPVIRWIMNHMVIVFVTVLVVAGLVYQDQIEQEMVQLGWMDAPTQKVTSVSASTAAPTASAAPEVSAPAAAEAPAADTPSQMPTHLTAQAAAPAAAPAQAPAQAAAAAAAPAPQAQAQAQAQAPVQQPYGYGPQGYGPRYGQAPQGYAQAPQGYQPPQGYAPRQMMGQMGPRQMAPQMPQMQQMPTPPSMGADVGLDDAIKGQWSAARTAYWERDLEKAEELYKALVESSTEADVAGELGNIYFVQGRHEDAAAMFYEAGLRHLKGDNPVRAGIVMGPLSQLDREKANDLREKMMKIQRAQVEAQIEAQKKAQAELMPQQPEQTKN